MPLHTRSVEARCPRLDVVDERAGEAVENPAYGARKRTVLFALLGA